MEIASDVSLTDDQHFLLYLIMGAYFGPDLKEERPRKSALQRLLEGLPQYHANDLAGSHMKTTVMENVYYYILRKADSTYIVKQPWLLQYVHGVLPLPLPGTYLQFNDLFPPKLHQRSQYDNQHLTVANIALINNPEINYMNPADIERFKKLTGLEAFALDRAMAHVIVGDRIVYNPEVQRTLKLDDTMQHPIVQPLDYVRHTEAYPDGSQPSNSSMPFGSSPCIQSFGSIVPPQMTASSGEDIDQGMLFLPSCPSTEEWGNLVATINRGFALTGSAARGTSGASNGPDGYWRVGGLVSFPCVPSWSEKGMKIYPRIYSEYSAGDFSCEVESDGTVIIKGVTVTGERRVERYSQVFEMQSQNLCPPGPFSISFKLPGPVDPQQFHGTFATDGILEE